MKVDIKRDDQTVLRTYGKLYVDDVLVCESLELPDHGNAHNISCIPVGEFEGVFKYSPKHDRNLWHIMVPGRDDIEIHIGNSVIDTDGCVLCGTTRGRLLCIDGVTRDAVLGSHGAFDRFEQALSTEVTCTFVVSLN